MGLPYSREIFNDDVELQFDGTFPRDELIKSIKLQ